MTTLNPYIKRFEEVTKQIREEKDPVKRQKLKMSYMLELYGGDKSKQLTEGKP